MLPTSRNTEENVIAAERVYFSLIIINIALTIVGNSLIVLNINRQAACIYLLREHISSLIIITSLFVIGIALPTMCIYLLTTAIASHCMSISLLSIIFALSAELAEYRSAFAAHFLVAFAKHSIINRFLYFSWGWLMRP